MKKQKQRKMLESTAARISERIIIHVDADCFSVQMLTKDDPSIQNKPIIVTNDGEIMSINYPAKEYGISRRDRIPGALEKCPELIRIVVPDRWGKVDVRTPRLTNYSFIDCVENYRREQKAAIKIDFCGKEEFYMDVSHLVTTRLENVLRLSTPSINFTMKTILESEDPIFLDTNNNESFWDNVKKKDLNLIVGGMIAFEIVQKLKLETGYQFSAGVANNKLLATLACERNKPAAVTILTEEGLSRLASQTKLENIRQLGGKRGQDIKDEFQVDTMGGVQNIAQNILVERFGLKKGSLIHRLACGMDDEEVTETIFKLKPSIKCSINLCTREGTRVIRDLEGLNIVVNNLAEEMVEWLQEERIRNRRRPRLVSINLSRPCTDNPNSHPYAGSFNASEDLTEEEIVTKSMELLQNIWDKHGMPIFTELTQVRIIAKNFASLTDEDFN